MTLAVTGASGQLGRLVVGHLLANGVPADQVVVLVRRPEAVADLATQGVLVRAFDYELTDSLASALEGVDSLLLISGNAIGQRFAQHRAVIDAAVAAGVSRLLYTSAPHADASINPVAPEHKATEEYLASSGIPYLVLRNGWYHENYLADLASAASSGVVLTAAGQGRVASASRSDLAEGAAVLLAGEETGRIYTLTGDVAWTQDELAAVLAEVSQRPVLAQHVSAEEKQQALTEAGLNPGVVGFVVGVDAAIAAGELGDVNGELSGLLGRPTTPLVETLRSAS